MPTHPPSDTPAALPDPTPAQREVFAALPIGVALLDERGRIAYANPAWRDSAAAVRPGQPGLAVGDDYAAGWLRAPDVDRDGASAIADGVRAVLEGRRERFAGQYAVPSPTAPRWVHLEVTDTIPGCAAAVFETQLTGDVLAREGVRESERRFGGMLDNLALATVMLDREARITYCNAHLLQMTGWRLDEVLGRDWFELFLPAEVGEVRPAFADLLRTVPDAWHRENRVLTRGGERRTMRWSNSVLRDTTGAVVGTASIGEDITERRRAEAVFARRAAELERFHRLSVGRELRMIAMKKQVNAFAAQAGQAPPYDLAFLDQADATESGGRDDDAG